MTEQGSGETNGGDVTAQPGVSAPPDPASLVTPAAAGDLIDEVDESGDEPRPTGRKINRWTGEPAESDTLAERSDDDAAGAAESEQAPE